jgi:hypothetical protein
VEGSRKINDHQKDPREGLNNQQFRFRARKSAFIKTGVSDLVNILDEKMAKR